MVSNTEDSPQKPCCCCCSSLKSEFQVQNFCFSIPPGELSWVHQFGDSPWVSKRFVYVLWRLFLASVIIAGFFLDLSTDIQTGVAPWFPIYLTNWALFVETCYLIVAFFISLWIFISSPNISSEQPWPTKAAWLLRSIGQPGAVVVTVSYWTLVYTGQLTLLTFWIHAINTIVVVVDVLTSCYEVRLLHYIYILAFGITYVVWTVIHYELDIGTGPPPTQRYIYSVLDWAPGHVSTVRCPNALRPSPASLATDCAGRDRRSSSRPWSSSSSRRSP